MPDQAQHLKRQRNNNILISLPCNYTGTFYSLRNQRLVCLKIMRILVIILHTKKTQQGAFLIISMILLIVLSGLSIATMTMVTTDNRTTRNYGNFLDAKAKATAMAEYGVSLLE